MSSATVATGTDLRIETRLEPLTLLPDQAVPLSLLILRERPDRRGPSFPSVMLFAPLTVTSVSGRPPTAPPPPPAHRAPPPRARRR